MKFFKLIVLCLSLLLIFSGCSKSSNERPVEIVDLSIGVQDNAASSLIFIADQMGYFTDNGLEVTINKYPSGKIALNSMLQGEVELATTADIPIMMGAIKQQDFKIISTIAETDKGAWIIARKDHGVNKVEDLKGKLFATQENSAVHFFLHLFLLKNHIHDGHRVKFMEAVDLPDALVGGQIDAFSMRNPFIKEAKDQLGDKAVEFFEPGLYVQSFNIVACKEFIEIQATALESFLKALVKAEQFIEEDKTGALESLIAYLGEDRKTELTHDFDLFDFQVSLKQYLIILLEDETVFASRRGLVERDKMPNFLEYIYPQLLGNVDSKKVTIIR